MAARKRRSRRPPFVGFANFCGGVRYLCAVDDGHREIMIVPLRRSEPVRRNAYIVGVEVCPRHIPDFLFFDSLDDASLFAREEARDLGYEVRMPEDLKPVRGKATRDRRDRR